LGTRLEGAAPRARARASRAARCLATNRAPVRPTDVSESRD